MINQERYRIKAFRLNKQSRLLLQSLLLLDEFPDLSKEELLNEIQRKIDKLVAKNIDKSDRAFNIACAQSHSLFDLKKFIEEIYEIS